MKQKRIAWPKITGGTWSVGRTSQCVVSDSSENLTIYGSTNSDGYAYYGGNLICESATQANARLIAASPSAYAWLVKEWEAAQNDCAKDTTQFWRTDMPFMEPKCFVRARELRTILESAGFTFTKVDNDTDVVNTK